MKKEVGIIGLGKMGGNMAKRLTKNGWRVVGWSLGADELRNATKAGVYTVQTPRDLVSSLSAPRTVIVMVPAGAPVETVLFGTEGLATLLQKGDTVIDGGNSYYEDTQKRGKKMEKRGVTFLDAGISGGPAGALNGACIMVGGNEHVYKRLLPLFKDLALENAVQFFPGIGAGHFVKMVHNGIEYGMMQALAEGFAVLKKSRYGIDLKKAADLYNHASVIESRLVGWALTGFRQFGEELKEISPTVAHTGEGEWTVKTANKLKVPVPIIEGSYQFRVQSSKKPSYTGRVLSMLRNQFGGHSVK